MKRKTGRWTTIKTGTETYRAYTPLPLPPSPPVNTHSLTPLMEQAAFHIATLNTLFLPNPSLFVTMSVRKEALLSSQIEGTQSSFSDVLLFENNARPDITCEDVEEVSHYVKALNHGLARLREGFPLCIRLLREMHAILMQTGRGSREHPGEFRTSQNWIGGTRPGNALFVPPPPQHLSKCLGDFESFLHDSSTALLIKVGLAHAQFETIHPFLDGNGRLGRLLITLLLCHEGLLTQPLLYLSLYLKQNRTLYYRLLQEVRTDGTWENWLEFFLKGVAQTAQETVRSITRIQALFQKDTQRLQHLGRQRFSCIHVLAFLQELPQVSVPFLTQKIGLSAPTLRTALNTLTQLGIIDEISGKQRDKLYVYTRYLRLLEEGTAPLKPA